ncbi:hypothetical protein VPH35_057112 [Triticum aestivum]|uniref:Uncharacterized protein n=2 Tax=Aegilops tauschii TaxID=37682 RepID=A0A453DNK5_AEGTS
MATSRASLLAVVAVFSMLFMSSLGNPRPLCSDCDPQCTTNCTAEAKIPCRSYCDFSPQRECERQVFGRCTEDGICCSSNGTCTCDCDTVAKNGCERVSDNSRNCHACTGGIIGQCYHPCYNDCSHNCKKKGCHHA